jgi:hypothetical protein
MSVTLSNIIDRLESFKLWQYNWDAEGGLVPNKDAIDLMLSIVPMIFVNLSTKIKPTLTPNGFPVLFIAVNDDVTGEITVEDDLTISFFFDKQNRYIVHSVYDMNDVFDVETAIDEFKAKL